LFQVLHLESALVLAVLAGEEEVVIFPECVLVGCALARLGGGKRFAAQEGEMEETQTDFARCDIIGLDLTPRVSDKFAAEWSLEVAEFDDRHRRIGRADEVPRLASQEAH
jgi:hypothetical protein